MADPQIKLKRSSVASKRPSLEHLSVGEFAVNTYDGNLFTRQETGGVGIATTVTNLTPWQENYGGTAISYGGNVNVSGVSTLSNTVVGGAKTELLVNGDARITGILTIGTGSITLNPNSKKLSGVDEIVIGTSGVTVTLKQDETGGIKFVDDNGAAAPTSVGIGTTVSINTTGIITARSFVVEGVTPPGTVPDYSSVTISGLSLSAFNTTYNRQSAGYVLDTGTVSSGNALFKADSSYYYYVASNSNSRMAIWSEEDNNWMAVYDLSNTDYRDSSVSDNQAIGGGGFGIFQVSIPSSSTTTNSREVPEAGDNVSYGTTTSPAGTVGFATIYSNGNATFTGIVTASQFYGDGSNLTGVTATVSGVGTAIERSTVNSSVSIATSDGSIIFKCNGDIVASIGQNSAFLRVPLNVDGNKITNLPRPESPSDASTKDYVDNQVDGELPTGDYGDIIEGSNDAFGQIIKDYREREYDCLDTPSKFLSVFDLGTVT